MKKLIRMKVKATLIYKSGVTTLPVTIETERLNMIGNNKTKKGYMGLALEALEIEASLNHSEKQVIQFENVEYKLESGHKKKSSRATTFWIKDHQTNLVEVVLGWKGMCEYFKMSKKPIANHLSSFGKEPITELFLGRYGFSVDGINFTGPKNKVVFKNSIIKDAVNALHKAIPVVLTNAQGVVISEHSSIDELAKLLNVRNKKVRSACLNVAINYSNEIKGRYVWFKKEFIPGVSKPIAKVERTYFSIRINVEDVVNKTHTVNRTLASVLDEVGLSTDVFRDNYLNRGRPLNGKIYTIAGSSCALPIFS